MTPTNLTAETLGHLRDLLAELKDDEDGKD
jgi:hypothetical protein